MAIDTTPSTVATNALNALDFSSLIGGPMEAIIKAQALAARTTYEYITQVGLTEDPDTGEKKPVNVTFSYNNMGQLATLTVPILVMLPIPNIEVTGFSIDFIANISASSSSTEETSSDSELGVEAEAEASLGIGPFSITVKAKANYSSKEHSKAAQESKYSVEYTMNVHVEGGQAGMPAGMQTVLNILQGSNSSVTADEQFSLYPSALEFNKVDSANLQVTIKDKEGLLVSGEKVEVVVKDDSDHSPFESITIPEGSGSDEESVRAAIVAQSSNKPLASFKDRSMIIEKKVLKAYGRKYGKAVFTTENAEDSKSGITNTKGIVAFNFAVKDEVYTGSEEKSGTIFVTRYYTIKGIDGEPDVQNHEELYVPYLIIPKAATGGTFSLECSETSIDLSSAQKSNTIEITAKEGSNIATDYIVKATVTKKSGAATSANFKAIVIQTGQPEGTANKSNASAKVDANGKVGFTFEVIGSPSPGEYDLTISGDQAEDKLVTITVS